MKNFQEDNYYIHESCPPKLRGDDCPRDCYDCVYDEYILNERKDLEASPRVHIQLFLPGMCPQKYFRGMKSDGLVYTNNIKVRFERV